MKRDVEFATEDGTTLRGFLYPGTAGSGVAPGIVMAHGFAGIKEQIDHYAALFAKAGLSVLVYDHRCFGASGGTPRGEVDPFVQVADWQDAITFALGQPEFDEAAPVGVWGSSFAGGLAMVIAACDSRVGSVVAQIPNVSWHRNAPRLLGDRWIAEVQERVAADRIARTEGKAPDTVPVFATEPEVICALPPVVDPSYLEGLLADGRWSNTVTVRSLQRLVDFEPAAWVPYVAPKPLLMVIGENDACTFPDLQREVFTVAGEPKSLVAHPGGHFDTYTTYFDISGNAARDWFVKHMLADSAAVPASS